MRKIIAIVSGGLDSVSFLTQFPDDEIIALSFQYGQKAGRELEQAKKILSEMKQVKEHKIIDISFMQSLYGSSNQLTGDDINVEDGYTPSVVVPLRNAIFSVIASAYGYSEDADLVLLGSHLNDTTQVETFEPMYPDCTPEFFEILATALHIGHFRQGKKIEIISPSRMGQTKADLIKRAYKNIGDLIFETWSCYTSGAYHCGKCESCNNRKAAFLNAGVEDKTHYEA